MNNRAFRLSIGLVVAFLPLVAILLVQLAPEVEAVAPVSQASIVADGQTPTPRSVAQAAPAQAPVINEIPDQTVVLGQQFTYIVEASEPVLTWTLPISPTGMTIRPAQASDRRAVIDWTPTTAGAETVSVRAQNNDGEDTETFAIFVVNPTPTNTPTRTPRATAIYVDQYEPNNSFDEAYTTSAGLVLPANTLWPAGDIDYFRFYGKAGSVYDILTANLDAALDTQLSVYGPNGNLLGTNDDAGALARASQVTISAGQNGYYYAAVVNLSPADSADQTYSLEIREVLGTATPTRVASVDQCEYNGTFQDACVLQLNTTYNFDFVPFTGQGEDNDFFRIWVKDGLYYTCETFDLSSLNDTNMIVYSCPGEQCVVAGNDDKNRLAGDLGSEVSVRANYTGWLYVLVGPGPNLEPEYDVSQLYTYNLQCTQVEATPTPTPSNTPTPRPFTSGTGSGNLGPTPTPFAFPTFPPTPTPITFPAQASPTPPPVIQIIPLPTPTPVTAPRQETTLDVTVYYDANLNFTPELTEGIMDVAVALYDSGTGELLSLGFTNEAGNVRFGPLLTTGAVRVSVPFLGYSQLISEASAAIQLRVDPRPLPGTIP